MRLEQSRLLEQENEIHRRDLENQRLRAEAALRQAELDAARRVRRWQALALVSAGLLLALLAALAWRQRARSRALARLALQDPLTGVANRAALEATAARWLAAARREQWPLSALLLDLDHFKAVNDRYGHAAGDAVLRACAAAWQAQLRGSDLLARTGGEEFCVLCAQTDAEAAAAVAARLLQATRALRLPAVDPQLQVRVSIGIAQWERGESLAVLLDRADAALYRAKQRGRDRCER
nr:GGDEF domain-containing protein [Thermomonas flagellata]